MSSLAGSSSGSSYSYFTAPPPSAPYFNAGLPPQSTKSIRAQVLSQAHSTRVFADKIINDQQPQTSSSSIVHHHYGYTPSWWFMPYYPQPVYVSGGRHSEDTANRVLFGLIATIVGGIALFAAGRAIGRYQAATDDLAEAKETKRALKSYENQVPANEVSLIEEGNYAADLKIKVCKRIRNSALVDLTLRVGLAVGAAMALLGAFALAPAVFMSAGAVIGLTAGGAMLFKLGLGTADRQNLRDAELIRASVQHLNAL